MLNNKEIEIRTFVLNVNLKKILIIQKIFKGEGNLSLFSTLEKQSYFMI
jgi:hypothetical protein